MKAYHLSVLSTILIILVGFTITGFSATGEFRVNTTTLGDQSEPSVAMDSDGSFVIVWDTWDDKSNSGIFAQRYDNDGNKLGSQIQVNSSKYDYQNYPSIAMDGDGNFFITWFCFNESSNSGIFVRKFNYNGIPLSNEVLVDSVGNPSRIAVDSAGNFVIAWMELISGLDMDVYARRYNYNCNPLGNKFRVNSYTPNMQDWPSIASDDSGNFIVVWESGELTGTSGQDGSGFGIYAQRYDIYGNPIGSEFRVNTSWNKDQYYASVSMDSVGNFIITWSSYQDDSSSDIYAKRYNNNASQIGTEFRVNTFTTNTQTKPLVALNNEGNFVIVWGSDGQDGSDYGIFAQKFDSNSNPIGNEFQVNTYTQDAQIWPSVDMNDAGNYIIAWTSVEQDGSGYGVYAKLYKVSTTTPTPTLTPTLTNNKTPTPTFTSTPSNAFPTLTNGKVEPETGFEDTSFEYLVYYNDADGGVPPISNVFINQNSKDMTLKSGNTWNGWYHLEILGSDISLGKNNYYFVFVDDEGNNVRYPVNAFIDGPEVKSSKTPSPTLTPTSTPTTTPEPTIEWELKTDPNQFEFNIGNSFSLLLDINTPPVPLNADIYLVLLQYSTENLFFAPLWSLDIMPVFENIVIPDNINSVNNLLFEVTIPQNKPPVNSKGQYTFAIGATKSDTVEWISNIATASFVVKE